MVISHLFAVFPKVLPPTGLAYAKYVIHNADEFSEAFGAFLAPHMPKHIRVSRGAS